MSKSLFGIGGGVPAPPLIKYKTEDEIVETALANWKRNFPAEVKEWQEEVRVHQELLKRPNGMSDGGVNMLTAIIPTRPYFEMLRATRNVGSAKSCIQKFLRVCHKAKVKGPK